MSLNGSNSLQVIGPEIYLFEPTTVDDTSNAPSLIILCTWIGGATPQRIAKFAKEYHSLYPSAAVLIVAGRLHDVIGPAFALRTCLTGARDVIRNHVAAEGHPQILLHVFSNGGSFTAVQLATSLQSCLGDDGKPLQLHKYLRGVILDCCPGDTSFSRLYSSIFHVLPPKLPSTFAIPVVLSVASLMAAGHRTGLVTTVDDVRKQLNDPSIFGSARRLYLYSSSDSLVRSQDVELHMDDARLNHGYAVDCALFNDIPHCALAQREPSRYWTTVHDFWDNLSSTHDDEPFDFRQKKLLSSRL